jgi:hypothetical protein
MMTTKAKSQSKYNSAKNSKILSPQDFTKEKPTKKTQNL